MCPHAVLLQAQSHLILIMFEKTTMPKALHSPGIEFMLHEETII